MDFVESRATEARFVCLPAPFPELHPHVTNRELAPVALHDTRVDAELFCGYCQIERVTDRMGE